MYYAPEFDVEINRASILVRKDHRQRWVYKDRGTVHITDQPIPCRDDASVYWMPIQGCVACTYRPRVLAHNAIGAL